jgi:hypothetical protein
MRLSFAVICLVATLATPAAAQDSLQDEFSELDWNVWCPCLINMTKAPIGFLPDSEPQGDHFAQIIVDENSLGGNKCRRNPPHSECRNPATAVTLGVHDDQPGLADTIDSLGPNFMNVFGARTFAMAVNDYCTPEVMARAKAAGEEDECIQRQELQFQKPLVHDAAKPYLYSFRFRMPGTVEDTVNSIRWVTAQWKEEPVSNAYSEEFGENWGPSPFLAQRFDNGVLHVTVQDEHCRCMVASAPPADNTGLTWENGVPKYCLSTHPKTKNQACTPDLKVEYGDDPVLSSPVDRWVEMTYRVQAGRDKPAMIEIHEGARFIVRITGSIGYQPEPGETVQTRFKIGQYRDYMPTVDAMDIDWVKREPAG